MEPTASGGPASGDTGAILAGLPLAPGLVAVVAALTLLAVAVIWLLRTSGAKPEGNA
jgi:hypothetical protein